MSPVISGTSKANKGGRGIGGETRMLYIGMRVFIFKKKNGTRLEMDDNDS